MDEILTVLRAATADTHQCLEDAVQIERRVADPVAYRRLLEIFLGFYRPLERRLGTLHGWQENGLDFFARRKTPWLESDLLALNSTATVIDALPDCAALPPTESLAQGFGCFYVLEGATLGGRQITAMMRDSPVPANARRFFASYGAETGARWREFITVLESHANATNDAGRNEIVHGARETFACLQDWFVRQCQGNEPPG